MSQVGQVVGILRNLNDEYQTSTPRKLKLIDAYLVYVLLTGIVQFAYCLLVGTFPFNSFLSGFISTVGCFILAGKDFLLQKKIHSI
jgi:oligosaccharyltransferase complex subunit epsilon